MNASRIQGAIAVLARFGGAGVGRAQSVPAPKGEDAQSKAVVQVTERVTENVAAELAAEVPWGKGSAGENQGEWYWAIEVKNSQHGSTLAGTGALQEAGLVTVTGSITAGSNRTITDVETVLTSCSVGITH